jgi:hypothetical protein
MIHAHHLAADHPVIVKIAAGTPLAPADQDALYLLLADDSIRRLSLEHHLAAAGDQLGRLPPSPTAARSKTFQAQSLARTGRICGAARARVAVPGSSRLIRRVGRPVTGL